MSATFVPFTLREDLELKISIRETRAKYAKGARKIEEERVLTALRVRLASVA